MTNSVLRGKPYAEHPYVRFDEGGGKIALLLLAAMCVAAFAAVADTNLTSEPTVVFVRPQTSSFWNTATNSTVTLPIYYPSGASSATLTVNGDCYSRTYPGITGTSFDLHLPEPNAPELENVYDLALVFDNGKVCNAKLGLIQGIETNGSGFTRCIAPANDRAWNSMRKRAVFPIPYGTTQFSVTVNNQQRVNETDLDGSQGWYVLGDINRRDEVSLSLTTMGTDNLVDLVGRGNGYFILNFK